MGAFRLPRCGLCPVVAIVYSLQSGWQAKRHKDMPYTSRQEFERITPYILGSLALLLVLASLPYVRTLILHRIASQGIVGFIMAAGGAALGLWSRFAREGNALARRQLGRPGWCGTVIYGSASSLMPCRGCVHRWRA